MLFLTYNLLYVVITPSAENFEVTANFNKGMDDKALLIKIMIQHAKTQRFAFESNYISENRTRVAISAVKEIPLPREISRQRQENAAAKIAIERSKVQMKAAAEAEINLKRKLAAEARKVETEAM